jgi:ribonuclease P protein component
MTLFAFPNNLDRGRLGIAATRKLGGAVSRNRAKRRVRELFRTGSPPAGLDVVIVARRELIDAPWDDLVGEFRTLIGRQRAQARPRRQS